MFRFILAILFTLFLTTIVMAETTSYTIGNTTYYNGDLEGTATKTGSYTYYNINGERGTEVKVGSTTYFNGELFNKDK
jgi:hypothetical protein